MNLAQFEDDRKLVHGEVSIADSLTPPAPYGTYSIRLPQENMPAELLSKVKILLWSCMDKRVVRPLYDLLLAKGYSQEEILVVSMGGGPIQEGESRTVALKQAFIALAPKLPNLTKIWGVAHSQGCGGLKFFCGGNLITDVAKPEYIAQAQRDSIDPEIFLTDQLLENGRDLLPASINHKVEFAIAEPYEPGKSVIVHEHKASVGKPLRDLIK